MTHKGKPGRKGIPRPDMARLFAAKNARGKSIMGVRANRIKAVRRAHAAIRASGRVPGQEARAQALINKKARREAKERAAKGIPEPERIGNTLDE